MRATLRPLAAVGIATLVGGLLWQFDQRLRRLEEGVNPLVEGTAQGGAPQERLPPAPVLIGGLPSLGRTSAPLVVIEFADFQCPYCRSFALSALPEIKRELVDTGRIRLVYFPMPLEMLHDRAVPAAMTAFCAGEQGTFWTVHDRFFSEPGALQPVKARTLAADSGIDMAAFDECSSTRAEAAIRSAMIYGRSLGVASTPLFFVGRPLAGDRVRVVRRIRGIVGLPELASAISEIGG